MKNITILIIGAFGALLLNTYYVGKILKKYDTLERRIEVLETQYEDRLIHFQEGILNSVRKEVNKIYREVAIYDWDIYPVATVPEEFKNHSSMLEKGEAIDTQNRTPQLQESQAEDY